MFRAGKRSILPGCGAARNGLVGKRAEHLGAAPTPGNRADERAGVLGGGCSGARRRVCWGPGGGGGVVSGKAVGSKRKWSGRLCGRCGDVMWTVWGCLRDTLGTPWGLVGDLLGTSCPRYHPLLTAQLGRFAPDRAREKSAATLTPTRTPTRHHAKKCSAPHCAANTHRTTKRMPPPACPAQPLHVSPLHTRIVFLRAPHWLARHGTGTYAPSAHTAPQRYRLQARPTTFATQNTHHTPH
jgi:hypothetical protein